MSEAGQRAMYSPRGMVEPSSKVVALAQMLAFGDFPRASDILAIARAESSFNPNARNKVSRGIMQVNHGSFDVATNLHQGVALLREYYILMGGSVKAAVLSYNSGPSNYRKGRFVIKYWEQYKEHEHVYRKWLDLPLKMGETVRSSTNGLDADYGHDGDDTLNGQYSTSVLLERDGEAGLD